MEISDIIAVVGSICAIVFGYLAFVRNRRADDKQEAGNEASVLTEIGYIKANTDEIKAEQKEQRKANLEFVTRLTQVESDVHSINERLRRVEGDK